MINEKREGIGRANASKNLRARKQAPTHASQLYHASFQGIRTGTSFFRLITHHSLLGLELRLDQPEVSVLAPVENVDLIRLGVAEDVKVVPQQAHL